MNFRLPIALALLGLLPHAAVQAAGTDSLILNEANTVSGGVYLKGGKSDPTLGRVEGNGQNWMNFIAAGADPGQNTIDLRGYQVDWSYDKDDGTSHGSGVITFSQDPTWAAVPQGTMITVNEYQKAWYLVNTPPASSGNPDGDTYTDPSTGLPGGGMQRVGGINGFGQQTGSPFNPALDTMRNFSTNTAWNPAAQAGPNWNMNVWAGQGLNSAGQGQFFSFSGTVTTNSVNDQGGITTNVGIDSAAGLFATNNDNWQFTIKDAQGNVVEGPIGEAVPGWGTNPDGSLNGAGGVGSDEVLKLQQFLSTQHATAASYQGVSVHDYFDGGSSNYAAANQWTINGSLVTQDLSPLRNWFGSILPGDANLNGTVNFGDFQTLQNNFGKTGVGWQQGDFNGDGTVNFADFQLLQNSFGQSSGGAPQALGTSVSSVPEPSTLGLLSCGVLALIGVRRRLVRR